MDKPLFSTVVICRNEEHTLPKLLASLSDFKARGGNIVVLDTGSTDRSVDVATANGAVVTTVGDRFRHEIDKDLADKINERFVVDESPIVKAGESYFHFADARNYAASLAPTDMVSFADADEAFTKLDVDRINALIEKGYNQFLYEFVFAHNPDGSPSVAFDQSKFYDRTKMHWNNAVHEVLAGQSNMTYLSKDIFRLEHWQVPGDRHSYLVGLAVDCFQRQEDDRNSHYFARELFWSGRYKSALKEFQRHITMNGWPAERAESMIYMGDCYGKLNNPSEQVEWYQNAFNLDAGRRKSLLKLAQAYRFWNDPKRTAAYAAAALQIPRDGYYANDMREYTALPHELLYWANGWMGNIKGAQDHITEALRYEPYNNQYLTETKYYFEYQYPGIDGWMKWDELMYLHDLAKKYDTICEVGSWKGRSTHAMLAAKHAHITCVDSWEGAIDNRDLTSSLAKQADILAQFMENTKEFTNKTLEKGWSTEVAKRLAGRKFDATFIDAGHDYQSIHDDLVAYLPLTSKLLCGHDYMPSWMGVIQAVDEMFGKPDGVCDTIWYVDLTKRDPTDLKKHL